LDRVVDELRGVGKNMQDHYLARVSYGVEGAETANERSRGLRLAGEATPDMQVTFAPGSFKNGQIAKIGGVGRKSGRAFRRHRTARRRITLRSSAPTLADYYRARDELGRPQDPTLSRDRCAR
jgi:hypothetical protein